MSEMQNNTCCSKPGVLPYIIINILFSIIAILAFFVGKNYDLIFSSGFKPSNSIVVTNSGSENNQSNTTQTKNDIIVKVVGDKRCTDCQTSVIVESLKKLDFLKNATFEEVDFSDKGIKDFVKANDIKTLPAILLNTKNVPDEQFAQYLTETPSKLFNLAVGGDFDPFAEICDNKVDDNGDSKIDCDDTTCAKNFTCAPKVDRPVADLYIMSYCPYGLQAQKGYLEVMSKLSKVADINVKFVQYVMHEQKEADENVVQHCIQKNEKDKYLKYLECFLKEDGKNEACRKEVKIDETKLTSCIKSIKKEFKVDEKMKDKTKQFPDFDLNKKEALEAGVEGSPTFVVNGIKIDKAGRNAKSYADIICSSFKVKPVECDQKFQDINFDPMFGFTSNGSNADSGCAK